MESELDCQHQEEKELQHQQDVEAARQQPQWKEERKDHKREA